MKSYALCIAENSRDIRTQKIAETVDFFDEIGHEKFLKMCCNTGAREFLEKNAGGRYKNDYEQC